MAFFGADALIALIITTVSLTITMAAEMVWPRRRASAPAGWRWCNNFGLALLTWFVSRAAGLALLLFLARWTQLEQIGLFQRFDAGFWLPLLTLTTLFQLCTYLFHLAFHHIPWLWRLHAVHHSDVDVDISTSYRHHPLEPLVSLPVLAPLVMALGIAPQVALAHQVFIIFVTVFSHTNVRLPQSIDRVLRRVVVTPDFHRVHHSRERDYTNSNYGNQLPWFDYLFGTAKCRPYDEQEHCPLGLEYDREPGATRLDRMLASPFRARPVSDRRSR